MLSGGAPYPKKNRLLRRSDYLRLSSTSTPFFRGRTFILLIMDNECAVPRIGITVSRKVGNAVVRNRLKRVVRELFRHACASLPAVDLHLIARRAAADDAGTVLVRHEFTIALQKIGSR